MLLVPQSHRMCGNKGSFPFFVQPQSVGSSIVLRASMSQSLTSHWPPLLSSISTHILSSTEILLLPPVLCTSPSVSWSTIWHEAWALFWSCHYICVKVLVLSLGSAAQDDGGCVLAASHCVQEKGSVTLCGQVSYLFLKVILFLKAQNYSMHLLTKNSRLVFPMETPELIQGLEDLSLSWFRNRSGSQFQQLSPNSWWQLSSICWHLRCTTPCVLGYRACGHCGSALLHAFQGGVGAKPPQGVLSYFELPNSDNSISCSSDRENSKRNSDQALSLLVFL